MMKQIPRTALFAAALLTPLLIEGCGGARSFFYINKNTQAIRRDTITATGVTTFIQNPQDSVNGIVRLAPVELLGLQPVTIQTSGTQPSPFDVPRQVMLPPGFTISLHAAGLGRPRDLILREDGTLFYADIDGRIMARTTDGKIQPIVQQLRSPHGLELHNGALYYTEETRVFRFDFDSPTGITGKSTILTDKIPVGGDNYTRTIRWSPSDKRFYISVGSSTNKGIEDDNAHATILRMPEGGGNPDAATRGGLRNTVAMDIHPETGELWGLDNGTELLAEHLPPLEVNILKVGKHYGWPFFYSRNFPDPDYMDAAAKSSPRYPQSPTPPVIELESHAEALDMEFYTGTALGEEWKNAALISFHNKPKVIRLRANADGSNARQADFLTGFETLEDGTWGRPVGIAISSDGRTIYVSDDRAGAIYKISKQ